MAKANELPVDLQLEAGSTVTVSLQPGMDIDVSKGSLGGMMYRIPCQVDGGPAVLGGGKRLWAVIAPLQRACDASGKPLRVKVGKEGVGTATTWTAVRA